MTIFSPNWVGSDETRETNLFHFKNGYNLIADGYASGIPSGDGDIVGWDLQNDPIYSDPDIDPLDIHLDLDWRMDDHFRLVKTRARGPIDYSDITALKAGVSELTTSMDSTADSGPKVMRRLPGGAWALHQDSAAGGGRVPKKDPVFVFSFARTARN